MKKSRWSANLLSWVVPVILVMIWQGTVQFGLLSARILPAPVDVLLAGIKLVKSGELFMYLGISSRRALIGFAIGGSLGFVLGLLNGLFPVAERLLDTSLQMVRTIPHLALIPLVILWFGIGEEAKLFLVAFGVLFPVYLNTFHGVRTVDRGLLEMGRIYGLRGSALFWHIILPSALPSILIGIRFALGVMWLTLIVAETISADSGIGYMAMNAREFMQMDVVVLSILLYAVIGKLSDAVAKLVERKTLPWHPAYQKND